MTRAEGDGNPTLRLQLLGGFELSLGPHTVRLPSACQRLVALLAIHTRWLARAYVAGTLWRDTPEDRANARLRSLLWRLPRPEGSSLVEASLTHLRLGTNVSVDYRETHARIGRLFRRAEHEGDLDPDDLMTDLVPDWYDEWAVAEAHQHRQSRIHALELVCTRLAEAGRYGPSLQAGLAAVAAEPLRESAHRRVIEVHLLEGNAGEAIQQYRRFCATLERELGLRPSSAMERLVATLHVEETAASMLPA